MNDTKQNMRVESEVSDDKIQLLLQVMIGPMIISYFSSISSNVQVLMKNRIYHM